MAEMAGKSDCRGVFRGGCTQCACDGYDGGVAGKKCDNCGHPPTKHQKLSTSGSSDSVGVPIAKFSLSGPRCSFPSCDEEAYHDLNTNTQKKLCQKHLRVMSMVQSCDLSFSDSDENECTGTAIHTAINSPQQPLESAFMKLSQSQPAFSLHNQPQTPLSTAQRADLPTSVSEFLASLALHQEAAAVPPDRQCKLSGCTRSRYVEKDGSEYDFCGKTHAKEYTEQQLQSVDPTMRCNTQGCSRPKHRKSNGDGYYDYCSGTCRDQGTVKSVPSLTSASVPNLSALAAGHGTCSLPGCNRPKYCDPSNDRIHDYCGRSHASQAAGMGIQPKSADVVSIRHANKQEITLVTGKFQGKWDPRKGACPSIEYVYVVTNPQLEQRWTTYMQSLQIQTVEEHYHGTKLICDITTTQTLCSDQGCGVCGISNTGLDRRCVRKNIQFQRFGHGFYLAPNSSKCHDYTQGYNIYRAMLLCDVCPGNKYYLTTNDETLTGPPQGYDCVYGNTGVNLNYEEIVLYNPDAIMPRYIIVYQKDGIGQIAS